MKTIIFTLFFIAAFTGSESFQLIARDIGGPTGEIIIFEPQDSSHV